MTARLSKSRRSPRVTTSRVGGNRRRRHQGSLLSGEVGRKCGELEPLLYEEEQVAPVLARMTRPI